MSSITHPEAENSKGDLWVFGYGSLMWRPGFDFIEKVPARLIGEHRALCVYSFVHRGTPEKPGLVLGLDRGGSCRGIAFRIAPDNVSETLGYLRERGLVTNVYLAKRLPIRITGGKRVTAVAYVVDRSHEQYAGALDAAEAARIVHLSTGQS